MPRPRRALLAMIGTLVALLTAACEETSLGPDARDPASVFSSIGETVTLVAAGNVARCATTNDDATAQLLDGIPGTVVALGDNAIPWGRLVDYQNCYGPTWGRHLARTWAVLGNHEYDSSSSADGAFDYFGSRAGPRPLGYYSFDLGDWHVIVLNDNRNFVPFSAGSAQDQWLAEDLAANAKPCILAMWHVPLFLSSDVAGWTSSPSRTILWERLFAAGADVVLNAQQHIYERMAPMRPDGTRDDGGIRQFNVGTGGESMGTVPTVAVHPNSEVRAAVYGVLKLTLGAGEYAWEFVPVAGESFTDSGTDVCHGSRANDTALVADADNTIIQPLPHDNAGAEATLQVDAGNVRRTLVRWEQQRVADVIGSGTLDAARVEVTITGAPTGWGQGGGVLDLYRLTQAWTEEGSTWQCADDAVPGNGQADCTGATAWDMGGAPPIAAAPTASVPIADGQSGVVTFDVTADVAAFLGGSVSNLGWLVKAHGEGGSGDAGFGSREGAVGPRLVLTVAASDTARPPVPQNLNFEADTTISFSRAERPAIGYYRNVFDVIFDDTTSGIGVRAFLDRYQAEIIAGIAFDLGYVIRVPDPGPTGADVDSLLTRMRAEPGVDLVVPIAHRGSVGINGRFPNDGPQASRGDWFATPTDGTRARRAIRAPLAWGCETGTYGTRPGVAVADISMTGHEDFPTTASINFPTGPFDTRPASLPLSHGMGVAGIVGAVGDNGTGIAGMVWDSDLRLFALADGNLIARNSLQRFEEILRMVGQEGLRILTTSLAFEAAPQDRDRAVTRVTRNLQNFLATNPQTLLIHSALNMDTVLANTTQLQALDSGQVVLHQAMARVLARFPDNVLIVGGTDAAGSRRRTSGNIPGSMFVPGVVEIMAPSTSILSLADPAEGGLYDVYNENSFAAPFVAGVAAQLLAFDSTLTPGQLKEYILRGAREPKSIDQNGNPVAVQDVDGLGVYQLDAYGSLSLASRERPNTTPICGGQLWTSGDTIFVSQSSALPPRVIPVPASGFLYWPSLAQGGRRIAVGDAGVVGVLIVDPAGVVQEALPGLLGRQYLERGTADLRFMDLGEPQGESGWSYVLTIRGTGNPALDALTDVDLTQRIAPDASVWRVNRLLVSPTGEWAAVWTNNTLEDNVPSRRWDLVPLPSGTVEPVIIQNDQECITAGGVTGCPDLGGLSGTESSWSHDGRRALITLPYRLPDGGPGDGGTWIASVPFVSGIPQVGPLPPPVQGVFLYAPRFTADDSLLVTGDFDEVAGSCVETRRVPSDPFPSRGSSPPVTLGQCNPDGRSHPVIFNVLSGVDAQRRE